jgi:AraC-like DNA-binding protein
MEPGILSMFWAAYPHWSTGSDPEALNYMVAVPLDGFLRFRLANELKQQLLGGEFLVTESDADIALDSALFDHWARTGSPINGPQHEAMMAMIEARLMTIGSRWRPLHAGSRPVSTHCGTIDASNPVLVAMLEILMRDFREEVSIEGISRELGLHPSNASRLFHRHCGMTCIEFLTQSRLAHAQNLLMTSDRKVLDVALDSGFRSISQFYAAFASRLKTTPQGFRRRMQQASVSAMPCGAEESSAS